MTRTRSLASGLLSLSAAAVLALTGAGGATAAPAASDDQRAPSVARASLATAGVAEYWTAERMRNAIPGDVLAKRAVERGVASGASKAVQGKATKVPSTKGKPTIAAAENPVSHIGKVFFTMGGYNYVCSGNSVASTNKSTVSTAGHCLNEGPGAFATNWVFVPAYENGAAPYGKWAANQLFAPTQWSANGDMTYDTGFAVVNTNAGGQRLGDVVGGSGVAFNQDRGLSYKAFGYPAASPFNGETLKSCTGAASNDPYNPQFNSQGISCDMTGGSSGGPWFIGTSSSGVQNSVNSYGYNRMAVMYGPYWGSVIQSTYNSAAVS
ncbi:trypsin-like serine peptidase [Pseudarthrobacter sp. NPDC058362]|uniref:trypsin-like serine peptidase n=1 Tax=Pseudarthrobacter sp. NPDC058362 TaxID=3346458 RepID=UPI00365E28F8